MIAAVSWVITIHTSANIAGTNSDTGSKLTDSVH